MRPATALLLLLALAAPARAQDFSSPRRAGPAQSALAFVESGLAPARADIAVEAATTRWFGLADLATRATAAGAGWRALRAAVAISQTGDAETGWSAAGIGCGSAAASHGVGLRAVARRDRAPDRSLTRLGPGVGAELGGGAWIEAAPDLRVWASAPQLWRRGALPPLRRALEIGARLEAGAFEIWVARVAPSRPAASAVRAAGLGLAAGPCTIWIESRDRPLRGTLGLSTRLRRVIAAAAVESHPVLGETIRLSIGVDRQGGAR